MQDDTTNLELSIIIPIYNEEDNLNYLFERLELVLENLDTNYEIICINDGSQDNSLQHLKEHNQRNPRIKTINFSRNFGKEVALSAGLDYSRGAAAIPIDADLQDPPELIGELVAKWREGYDVVYATRRVREEGWVKNFTASGFYRVIGKISKTQIPANTGDFRLIDRRVIEALKQMPERNRFMKGMFAWVGFKQTSVLFDRPQRHKGTTSWNYWKLWNFAIDGITSFSSAPLKIWTYVGLSISSVAFLYASFLIIRIIIRGYVDVPGYASTLVMILFFGGIQLITLGVIGEYLGRVYEEVKARPLYFVRESYGFEEENRSVETKQKL
ncbi:MAG: glycosyltransferase family 2 protein [Spirulinaceae cyanobacterium]